MNCKLVIKSITSNDLTVPRLHHIPLPRVDYTIDFFQCRISTIFDKTFVSLDLAKSIPGHPSTNLILIFSMSNRLSLKVTFDFSSFVIVSIKHWKCVVITASSFFNSLLWNKLRAFSIYFASFWLKTLITHFTSFKYFS